MKNHIALTLGLLLTCQLFAGGDERAFFVRNLRQGLVEAFPQDQITVTSRHDNKEIWVHLEGPTFRQLEYFQIAWWFMNDVCPKILAAGGRKRAEFTDVDNKLRIRKINLSATSATPEYDHGYELISWYHRHWLEQKNWSQ